MGKTRTLYILAVLLLPGCAGTVAPLRPQGRLDKARQRIKGRTKKESKREWKYERQGKRPGYYDSEDFFAGIAGSILVPIFYYTAAAPISIPRVLLHDGPDKVFLLPEYPYQNPFSGYFVSYDDYPEGENLVTRKEWGIRTSIEYGYDFDDIERTGFSLSLATTSRFGLKADLDFFAERLESRGRDDTAIWDINGTWDFARSRDWQFYLGLGAGFITDRKITRGGINAIYGISWFPLKPIRLNAEMELGNLGHAFTMHTRASAGLLHKNFEILAGYDHLKIDDVYIMGPFAGLCVWF